MATVALADLGAKTAAVLYNEADDYSRDVATVFKDIFARHGEIVASEHYLSGDSEFTQQLLRIKEAEADVLYLPGFHDDVAIQVDLARKLGITATLLGSDGWDQRLVPKITAYDDSYFSMHWDPQLLGTETAEFFSSYVGRFQSEPNGTAALTYDAVRLFLMAMQQQMSIDPGAIREGLMQLEPHQGVGGLIDFIDSGDPQKPVLIMHVKDGEKRFYKIITP